MTREFLQARGRFTNRVVVVTGASSGIGAATARKFAAEGALVVLAARRALQIQELATQLGAPQRALAIPTDVTNLQSLEALLEIAERHFGSVHIVVNNAAWTTRGVVEQQPVDALASIIDVNLKAPITLSRLALPYLRRSGGGAIVNVSSLSGRVPLPGVATYSATKFGLRAFSFALAEELRGSGITVSVLSSGPVDTPLLTTDIEEVPDIVFAPPISSADQVASLIVDCAYDGKLERVTPRIYRFLTLLGYTVPQFTRVLRPLLEYRGRLAKKRFQREMSAKAEKG